MENETVGSWSYVVNQCAKLIMKLYPNGNIDVLDTLDDPSFRDDYVEEYGNEDIDEDHLESLLTDHLEQFASNVTNKCFELQLER